MKRLPILLSLLASVAVLSAQTGAVLSPESRLLLHRAQQAADVAKTTAAADTQVAAYLTIDASRFDRQQVERLGGRVGVVAGQTATVRLPLHALQSLSQVEGVRHVQVASRVTPQLDVARAEAHADLMTTDPQLSLPYTGKGVIVGIVDAGFDYAHRAFYDAQGKTRIRRVWEQKTEATGSYHAPAAFGYGVELEGQDILETAAADIVNNSHGTHVAAIAAGSSWLTDGLYAGIAPDADIVLVSVDGNSPDNVSVSDAVAYIFNYADSLGMPCVVNLSLGMNLGPHDGTSPFDRLADAMQDKGKLIVGASGNYRGGSFHFNRTFASEAEEPLRTFVNFRYGLTKDNAGGEIDIWASPGFVFDLRLVAFNTFNHSEKTAVLIEPFLQPTDGSESGSATATFSSYISGEMLAAWEKDPVNGKFHLRLESALTSVRTNYALALEIIPRSEGTIDLWADNTYLDFTDLDIEGYSKPSPLMSSVCEVGGTAKRILSVGAYTTRNEYQLYRETVVNKLEQETVGAISTFSGMGPTADLRMKPEVAAPGCIIISAVSNYDSSSNRLVAKSYGGGSRYHLYGYMQGTSMAAPFVTGMVAAWLQAYPELSPEDLREVVAATARLDDFTGDATQAESQGFGYGKIDAMAGLQDCLRRSATGIRGVVDASAAASLSAEGVLLSHPAAYVTIERYAPDGRLLASHRCRNVAAGAVLPLPAASAAASFSLIRVKTPEGSSVWKVKD